MKIDYVFKGFYFNSKDAGHIGTEKKQKYMEVYSLMTTILNIYMIHDVIVP